MISTGEVGNNGIPFALLDNADLNGNVITDQSADATADGRQPVISMAAATVSDGGKVQLDPDDATPEGKVSIYYAGAGEYAEFVVKGALNNAVEIIDAPSNFTTTEDNDGTVNIYWDSGNGRYELNNETGGQRDFLLWFHKTNI